MCSQENDDGFSFFINGLAIVGPTCWPNGSTGPNAGAGSKILAPFKCRFGLGLQQGTPTHLPDPNWTDLTRFPICEQVQEF